jgi:hypothetical protein
MTDEERRKIRRSDAARKRSARRWTNRGISPPPSLRAYAAPWWLSSRPLPQRAAKPEPEPEEEEHIPTVRRYAHAGECP